MFRTRTIWYALWVPKVWKKEATERNPVEKVAAAVLLIFFYFSCANTMRSTGFNHVDHINSPTTVLVV